MEYFILYSHKSQYIAVLVRVHLQRVECSEISQNKIRFITRHLKIYQIINIVEELMLVQNNTLG